MLSPLELLEWKFNCFKGKLQKKTIYIYYLILRNIIFGMYWKSYTPASYEIAGEKKNTTHPAIQIIMASNK